MNSVIVSSLFLERLECRKSPTGVSSFYGTCRLRHCLTRYHVLQCENLRDKIYALLGLVDAGSVLIDYEKPVPQVFLDAIFARYCQDLEDRVEPMFFDSEYRIWESDGSFEDFA